MASIYPGLEPGTSWSVVRCAIQLRQQTNLVGEIQTASIYDLKLDVDRYVHIEWFWFEMLKGAFDWRQLTCRAHFDDLWIGRYWKKERRIRNESLPWVILSWAEITTVRSQKSCVVNNGCLFSLQTRKLTSKIRYCHLSLVTCHLRDKLTPSCEKNNGKRWRRSTQDSNLEPPDP